MFSSSQNVSCQTIVCATQATVYAAVACDGPKFHPNAFDGRKDRYPAFYSLRTPRLRVHSASLFILRFLFDDLLVSTLVNQKEACWNEKYG